MRGYEDLKLQRLYMRGTHTYTPTHTGYICVGTHTRTSSLLLLAPPLIIAVVFSLLKYGAVPPGPPYGRDDAVWEEVYHLVCATLW